ncbi:hypothetical protein [Curtobacterium sp. RRHDQ10]|uniref:hypothetical protein n=1 Tax=Curtobacterium phyllosphaerae TaxID=3413379 RepID=UPI003BF09766
MNGGAGGAVVVEVCRAVLGARGVVAPGRSSRATVVFDRVLGVRQLLQAALTARSSGPDAHRLGAAVDIAHAASMIPLVVVGWPRRGFVVRQLCVAAAFATAEVLLARAAHRAHGLHVRRR